MKAYKEQNMKIPEWLGNNDDDTISDEKLDFNFAYNRNILAGITQSNCSKPCTDTSIVSRISIIRFFCKMDVFLC